MDKSKWLGKHCPPSTKSCPPSAKRRKDVPQGSPLSPLLSKIMLHELDKYLETKGHKYVRYDDDFSIYCKSKSKAQETGNKVLFDSNNLR